MNETPVEFFEVSTGEEPGEPETEVERQRRLANMALLGDQISEAERQEAMRKNLRRFGGLSEETAEASGAAGVNESSSGSGSVWCEYHQFYLVPSTASADIDWNGECANALIEPFSKGGAVILTSVFMGKVRYTWRGYPGRPQSAAEAWEKTAEVIVRTSTGELYVESWACEPHDDSNLAQHGPGEYVVRCSA
ncbi:MAG: hypothetical protein J0H64_07810, partial [Actinobacteria bacterium]|nr:hypothetical protein [Actinomycetota bacterium]